MFKRSLAAMLTASTLAVCGAAAETPWRDVLDTPAMPSALASRALVNGIARSGNRLVAVGQRGHVLLSDDEGRGWQQARVPVSSDLVAVSFPDANAGFAAGHDGVVLHSGDRGATWTRVLDGRSVGAAMVAYYRGAGAATGDAARIADALKAAEAFATQGAENPFLDVGFENASTGYLVGAFGLILGTTDGGKTWQPLLHATDNPKALHLYAVRAVGGEVYIAGEQGLLLKLDRASGRFRALDLPYKGTLFGITGNERAVVVHGLRGTVLRSVDRGQSWQTVATGVTVGLTASAVDRAGRIVIVSQAGHVLLSDDDGASFALAKVDKPVPAAAVAFTGASTLVVGGPRGVSTLTLPNLPKQP